MIQVRPSDERGGVRTSWLDSRHTFSFGGYVDPRHMGFGALRVLNDDRVAPGGGFSPHGHRDMEIISYVVSGALAHADSTGHEGVIRPGEVQLMSAGTGVRHSEMNPSDDASVRFLQIWIPPAERGLPPAYAQRDFGRDEGVALLVSPDGRDGSLAIRRDVDVSRVLLGPGAAVAHRLRGDRAWVQVVDGAAHVALDDGASARLSAGDGAGIEGARTLTLTAGAGGPAEALIFDLP